MSSKVYVTQMVDGYDYMAAEKFGDVIFLTSSDFSSMSGSLKNKTVMREIRHNFREYVPGVDYIAATGSPVVGAVVFGLARERGPELRILRYFARKKEYVPIIITWEPEWHPRGNNEQKD